MADNSLARQAAKEKIGDEAGVANAALPKISALTKLKAGMLSAYYGKPVLDLKLIVLMGSEAEMAGRFLHAVLKSAEKRTAVMMEGGELKMAVLHKFLSDAWKAGVTYAVVTVPEKTVVSPAFYGLPVKMVGVFRNGSEGMETALAEFCGQKKQAKVVVETEDEPLVEALMERVADEDLIGYGKMPGATVRIVSQKGYKKGMEMKVMRENEFYTLATLETMGGETERLARVLAGVAVMAGELGVKMEQIVEAVADYEPKE